MISASSPSISWNSLDVTNPMLRPAFFVNRIQAIFSISRLLGRRLSSYDEHWLTRKCTGGSRYKDRQKTCCSDAENPLTIWAQRHVTHKDSDPCGVPPLIFIVTIAISFSKKRIASESAFCACCEKKARFPREKLMPNAANLPRVT